MSGRLMAQVVDDADLPSAALASDPDVILPRLVQVGVLGDADPDRLELSVEVLKHWPGKRCALGYSVTDRDVPAGPPAAFVAKVYRRPELAERVHRSSGALREQLRSGPADMVPAPLAHLADLGLALQARVDGCLLSAVLGQRSTTKAFASLGSWLAELHTAPPVPELPRKPLEHEVRALGDRLTRLEAALPPGPLGQARSVAARLADLEGPFAAGAGAMVHRDFYPGNVLCSGDDLWVIDFDWLAVGLPALDAGGLVAQVEKLSWFTTGRWDCFAPEIEAFLDAYSPTLSDPRSVRFGAAAAFLNLATDEVSRRGSDEWRARAEALVGRAAIMVGRSDGGQS